MEPQRITFSDDTIANADCDHDETPDEEKSLDHHSDGEYVDVESDVLPTPFLTDREKEELLRRIPLPITSKEEKDFAFGELRPDPILLMNQKQPILSNKPIEAKTVEAVSYRITKPTSSRRRVRRM